MNKKQKNRKLVKQNKRNRMINRRYSSTIKSLSKLFLSKIKTPASSLEEKLDVNQIVNRVYSVIDKAVKKGVIHKNTAARKKSRIGKLLGKI